MVLQRYLGGIAGSITLLEGISGWPLIAMPTNNGQQFGSNEVFLNKKCSIGKQ